MKIHKNFDKNFNVFNSQFAKYKSFYDSAPIALWIEDFTNAKKYLEEIAENHNTTPKKYLKENPEITYQLAQLVEVVDANQTAVTMHKASSKEELLKNLVILMNLEICCCKLVLSTPSWATMINQLNISEGRNLSIKEPEITMENYMLNIIWEMPLEL